MLTRTLIKSKAIALLKALEYSRGTQQKVLVKEVNDLVKEYPQSADLIRTRFKKFVKFSQDDDLTLRTRARQTLALIGYAEPPKSPGLRILSIDGGGTRGLVSLEILRQLERVTKTRIHELFDIICGVSSGSIITMAIGSGRYTLDQCENFYRRMSEDIFKTDFWSSTPRLLLNHAYYDSNIFEKTLKKALGNTTLLGVSSEANIPKLVAVAVNAHTMQPFLFRTYNLDVSLASQFDGTCKAELWQAVRASSAAPGFFQEYKFGSSILLDGGMLVNNCTGIAHAEASQLWPDEHVHCIVSVGSGKFRLNEALKATATSLYEKAHGLVYSATDTETIHMILQSSLQNYFRFNPQLSENVIISEHRKLKLDQLQQDANRHMLNNEYMLDCVAKKLTQPRQLYKRIVDKFK